ncbi:hypothetical protein FHX74_002957 [Friedmanniella endophytica]|uniref:Winged helix-turn-helix domain-containing protein n=1 Tax=Microlunatus kandeliicorticis TaxID=1759536 RepID=A0A7W3P6U3_9ACTN|nr:crosslink repair DNA glycosylase YcaQ family protein [Microlunatus kandeliicorticis]MBA8795329.1 hypothetical protein [Microlunatus kandeliicorticis]
MATSSPAPSPAPRRPRESLSRAEARRVVLAAQGLGRRPDRVPGMRDLQGHVDRLAQFQIDSINVVARAHYLPLFSRLGHYDPALLDRAAGRAPRRLFEYWGHAASLIDVTLQPALRSRMQGWAETDMWGSVKRIRDEKPELLDWVLAELDRRGPTSARDLDPDPERRRDHWGWNWSDVKTACEWLFFTGAITAARRNSSFERLYDLPERVLPPSVVATPTPDEPEAMRTLVRRAAQALGLASEPDLRDYFRTRPERTKQAVAELVEAGELLPVRVHGWDDVGTRGRQLYLWHRTVVPRRVEVSALVSPFDSVMFERDRLAALFDFDYRIEIYVPEAKRRYGYYVYPFLFGERFAARVDLKADRASGVLRVNGAWAEAGIDRPTGEVAAALAAELRLAAGWLGLGDVVVQPRGDLAAALSGAVSGGLGSGQGAPRDGTADRPPP